MKPLPPTIFSTIMFVGILLTGSLTTASLAQPAETEPVDEITIIGSRHDTDAHAMVVPVEILDRDALISLPDTDTDSILARLVPSYNVNQQSIDDEASFVRPANLRGLPADATLIFVNGKRRHKSSVITFLGGGISDGSHAVDLSSIPAIALERVEVLLDGASAQYGSDAVSGVINFVLRDDDTGGQFVASYGQYSAGDGAKSSLGFNVGMPLGNSGSLNLSAETYSQDRTSRVIQRSDAQGLIDAGNMHVAQPYAQTGWGNTETSDDYKFLANAKVDLNDNNQLYGFVNIAERSVNGGFYYRNPHTRSGVFKGPVDDAGTPGDTSDDINTIRVVSLDGSDGCNHIPIVNNAPDSDALAAVQASDNCFSYYEVFPGGFTPNFTGEVEDLAVVVGLKGALKNDWEYDLGLSYGNHKISYFLRNTINPQLAHEYALGNLITDFNPGGHEEEDLIVTLDFIGEMNGLGQPINVAYGIEYRQEEYSIIAGDPNSFFVYEDEDGEVILAEQGLSIGSNGFVGFPTSIAGSFERSNYAAYVDLGFQPSENLQTEIALRYEDYDDFGDTLDFKLSARYQVTPDYALRGTIGTGFRAPSAGQANTSKVTTEFGEGVLSDAATLPPSDPVAQQKGAQILTPEEALHTSLGLVYGGENMSFTADLFRIELDDRIASSSNLTLTEEDRAVLGDAAANYDSVRFFINDFETLTQGLDVKYDYMVETNRGMTVYTANLNYTKTSIEKYNPDLLNEVDVRLIEDSLPQIRLNLEANHFTGDWRILGRLRFYDSFYNNTTESAGAGFDVSEEWLVDVEVDYRLAEGLHFTLGGENLFDTYPDESPYAAGVGDRYAVDSPFGFSGAFYYARLNKTF